VSNQKWLFSPISALGKNFNPRNIHYMPVVKISARLELDETISFLVEHYLLSIPEWLFPPIRHLDFDI
jgi:hypothetical protein